MLKAVLPCHVVPGRAYPETVVGLKEDPTVNGQKVTISIVGGKVMLDGAATVVKTDIDCTNGVIHVIDQFILPK
jgi:transforming growth factor-beta-induced protein